MSQLTKIEHSLVEHHLCTVRDQATRPSEFRDAVQRLSVLIGVYATNDLAVQPTVIQTPLAEADCHQLSVRIGLVPILRAGLGMVDPLQDLLPDAAVWHLGMINHSSFRGWAMPEIGSSIRLRPTASAL